jgi:hypothetical protein
MQPSSIQSAVTCRLCPAPMHTYTVVEGDAGTVAQRFAFVCTTHYNEKDVRRAVRGIAAREQYQPQLRPIKLCDWMGRGGCTKSTTLNLTAYNMATERKMKVLATDVDDQNDLAAKLLRYSTTVWASQQLGARPVGDPTQTLEQVLASGGCYIRCVNGVDTPITHHTYMARPVTAAETAKWGQQHAQYPLVRQIPGHPAAVRSIQQSLEPFAVSGEGQALPIIPEKVPLQAIIEFLKTQEDGNSSIGLQAINTSDLGEIHVLYSGENFDRVKSQVNGSEHAALGAPEQRWQGIVQYLIDSTAAKLKSDIVLLDCNPNKGTLQRNLMFWADYMVLPMRGGCAANVEQVDKTLDCMYKNWGVHDGAPAMDERHLRIKGSWAQQHLFRMRPKVNSSFAFKLPMTVPKVLGYALSDIEVNRYGDASGKGSVQDATTT